MLYSVSLFILIKNYYLKSNKNFNFFKDSDFEDDINEDPVNSTIMQHDSTQLELAEMLCTQDVSKLSFHTKENDPDILSEDDQEDLIEKISEPRKCQITKLPFNYNENLEETICEQSELVKNLQKVDIMKKELHLDISCNSNNNSSVTPKNFNPILDIGSCFKAPITNLNNKDITISCSPYHHSTHFSDSSPLHAKLVYDWSSLLATGDQSDVCILTAEAEIPVHLLVLSIRCPNLLQEVQWVSHSSAKSDNNYNCEYPNSSNFSNISKIDWSYINYETAYSFMVYIYSGVCTVVSKKSDIWMGLFDLALKYQCQELVSHLENIYKASSPKKSPTEQNHSNDQSTCIRSQELEHSDRKNLKYGNNENLQNSSLNNDLCSPSKQSHLDKSSSLTGVTYSTKEVDLFLLPQMNSLPLVSSPVKELDLLSVKNNNQYGLEKNSFNKTEDDSNSRHFQDLEKKEFLQTASEAEKLLSLKDVSHSIHCSKLPKAKSWAQTVELHSVSPPFFITPEEKRSLPIAKESDLTPLPDYQSMVSPQLQVITIYYLIKLFYLSLLLCMVFYKNSLLFHPISHFLA